MAWWEVIELVLEHDYYAPDVAPLVAQPADRSAFDRAQLLLRQSGARVFVLAENENVDLPDTVTLDLKARNPDVIAVTWGSEWQTVPLLRLGRGLETAQLGPETPSEIRQVPGSLRLAQIEIGLDPSAKQTLTARFAAMSSHWAYHVIGPGKEEVVVEDSEGEIAFDDLGIVQLANGAAAKVIRSRAALLAHARPPQRFSLSRPGPFGAQTLIPVLPAPQPRFATVPGPDGSDAVIQSDIYVSLF